MFRLAQLAAVTLTFVLTCAPPATGQLRRNYCSFSSEHQLCAREPPKREACGRVLVQGAQRQLRDLILDTHNVVRSQTARGNVKAADAFLPQAAAMMQLEWDDELAEIAQAHAEKCKFQHDCGRCKQTRRFRAVGQNLAAGYAFRTSEIPKTLETLMGAWYREVRGYFSNNVHNFRGGSGAGHFTQMIWDKTTVIGCGVLARDMVMMNGDPVIRIDLFCNYGVGGNLIDAPVYTRGAPCSQCPPGTQCSSAFPGLCARKRT